MVTELPKGTLVVVVGGAKQLENPL